MSDLNEMLALCLNKSYLQPSELPFIDLYIDQVTTLISQRSENNSYPTNDKPLTKMMVNNYSKAGLIKPIKGKKYSREHVLQILAICSLKGALSINEIKAVLDNLYSDQSFGEEQLCRCYEQGLDTQQRFRENIGELIPFMLHDDNTEDRFTSLMAVCAMADSLSELAKRMAAEYFPPIENDRKSKKKD